jgi:hypothetical protein
MLSLLWDLEELKHLNEEGRQLKVDISIALDVICMPVRFQREHNLAEKLTRIRSKLVAFLKCLYRFRRTPASHIFVFMISSAQRNKKPYALPVQCIPYAGMKERDIRRLVNAVVKEMDLSQMVNLTTFVQRAILDHSLCYKFGQMLEMLIAEPKKM